MYFLKRRSPESRTSIPFSLSRKSFTHAPLLARPPIRLFSPQVGQGSISPLMLLLYTRVRVVGNFWARMGNAWKIRKDPRAKTPIKNHFFFILVTSKQKYLYPIRPMKTRGGLEEEPNRLTHIIWPSGKANHYSLINVSRINWRQSLRLGGF